MNELFDADGAIQQLEECQEIIFDYSRVMKDDDYLTMCNNLQFVFLEINQMKRAFHGQSSLMRDIINTRRYLRTDITSGDCMHFLLNVIKCIMWMYSFFVLLFTFYLIIYYHEKKQEEKIITSPEFQRYLKTFPYPN